MAQTTCYLGSYQLFSLHFAGGKKHVGTYWNWSLMPAFDLLHLERQLQAPHISFYSFPSNFTMWRTMNFLLLEDDTYHLSNPSEACSPGLPWDVSQMFRAPNWWQAERANDQAEFSPLCRSPAAVPHVQSCHMLLKYTPSAVEYMPN